MANSDSHCSFICQNGFRVEMERVAFQWVFLGYAACTFTFNKSFQ